MSKFEIEVVSYFEKEDLVGEIYYESIQWAEITKKMKA